MNKLIKINKLAVASFSALILGASLSSSALAASDNATVTGEVDPILTLTVAGTSNFTIAPGGVTSQTVANIDINSNGEAGYDVTLASTNGGNLAYSGTGDTIDYKVDYNTGDVEELIALTSSPINVENVATTTNGQINRLLDLTIASVDSAASNGNAAGNYTDIITVEILGK
jgi:hypothetical protein